MEDLIIKTLINYYTEKGIDLHMILSDPLYLDLSPKAKIEVLKKYAGRIESGINGSLSRDEIKEIIVSASKGALLAGLASGVGIAGTRALFKYPTGGLRVVAGTAIAAAGLEAARAYLGARNYVKNRADVKNNLKTLSKTPTDENAIRAMITEGLKNRPTGFKAKDSSEVFVKNIINSANPLTAGHSIGRSSFVYYNDVKKDGQPINRTDGITSKDILDKIHKMHQPFFKD